MVGGLRGPQLMVLSGFCLEMLEAAGKAPLNNRTAIGRAITRVGAHLLFLCVYGYRHLLVVVCVLWGQVGQPCQPCCRAEAQWLAPCWALIS